MRSLNQNDPRAKCCQKQNTGKRSIKLYMVFCGTVVVRAQSKTLVPIHMSEAQGGCWAPEQDPQENSHSTKP